MVRVNQFIALAAILALSLFAAQTTFAGPGGSAGDSFTVAGQIGLATNGNMWATDPLGAGGQMNEYEYQLFGPVDADYRFCAQWEAESLAVPVAVKQQGGMWMWWSKYDGSATTHLLFGNNTTDTPTVMDTDGDGIDELVVVRDVAPSARQWIVRDGLGSTSSVAETFLFGPAGSDPAPGNWDGDPANGDEPAVTRAGPGVPPEFEPSGNKLWQWDDGQGGVGSAMGGLSTDTNVAYTSNGQTRPGASRVVEGVNVFRVETAEGQEVVSVGPASAGPIGNCNL